MVYCGIWEKRIVGFVELAYAQKLYCGFLESISLKIRHVQDVIKKIHMKKKIQSADDNRFLMRFFSVFI